MIEFVEMHGLWWPKGSEGYCERYVRRAPDMEIALEHCRLRSVAVQAGGHCGAWPIWLAARFGRVYSYEPDAANFACLSRNICAKGLSETVYAARGMLADRGRMLSLNRSKKNIGGHKGLPEPGPIPAYRIDDLALPSCDLIVLDVEGMELPALQGAVETLERCRPVLMLEDNGLGSRHGWGGHDDLFAFLGAQRYREAARVAHDVVMVCA